MIAKARAKRKMQIADLQDKNEQILLLFLNGN